MAAEHPPSKLSWWIIDGLCTRGSGREVHRLRRKGQRDSVTKWSPIHLNLGERESPEERTPRLPHGRWGSAFQGRKTRHPGGASWSLALGGAAHVANWSEKEKASSSALWNVLILCLLILILRLTHLICFVMVLMLCVFARRDIPLFLLFFCLRVHMEEHIRCPQD